MLVVEFLRAVELDICLMYGCAEGPPREQPMAVMTAQWDFHAENPDELTFRAGDKVSLVCMCVALLE